MSGNIGTTIVINTKQSGEAWAWSVTLTDGSWSDTSKGEAPGPHQASQAAIVERERLVRDYEQATTHWHNEFGKEIVVRKDVHHGHPLRNGIETVWIQWETGDAFTYIRKVDVVMAAQGMINGTISRHTFVDLMASF